MQKENGIILHNHIDSCFAPRLDLCILNYLKNRSTEIFTKEITNDKQNFFIDAR